MTSKEDSAPENPAVTVEDHTDSAAYKGLGTMKVDTTDDGWGQGVFGDQEDTTQPPVPDRVRTEDAVLKITRTQRPDGEEEEEDEEISLFLPVVVAVLGVALVGVLAVWVMA